MVVFTFFLQTGNALFGEIWSIKSELSAQAEILGVLIALAKIPDREGSISSSSFYGQLPENESHVLALCT